MTSIYTAPAWDAFHFDNGTIVLAVTMHPDGDRTHRIGTITLLDGQADIIRADGLIIRLQPSKALQRDLRKAGRIVIAETIGEAIVSEYDVRKSA